MARLIPDLGPAMEWQEAEIRGVLLGIVGSRAQV
jgi:hypothetical protein